MPSPDKRLGHWFNDCLQPHESMLRAWLRSRFSDEHDIDDIVQEAYARVLRTRETTEIASPRAFLFATARNLALSNVRKRAVRSEFSLAEFDEIGVIDERVDIASEVARSEELELLAKAVQSLPVRCRQIITLRKIYGMSQKDIAKELGISVSTVESQGTIGMRKLTAYFERKCRG